MIDVTFWRGRRVFLTGHTGFKGGWLALWLQEMGAEVHGYALNPPTQPCLYDVASVGAGMAAHCVGDIRDARALQRALHAARPEVVFHLAAQSLVRLSYAQPVDTYSVNVMGTIQLLEAVRRVQGVRALVNVTSDKCYENHEWVWGYREGEAMGGSDPYSSSKGCAELVTVAYRRSFLDALGVGVATARAGNVIGGGDWALDRLVPDCLRALDAGRPLTIRSPNAVRPWQHVLEPLAGYLALAQRLCVEPAGFGEAWNFGPADDDLWPVKLVARHLFGTDAAVLAPEPGAGAGVHEAHYLRLDSAKARSRLGWRPRWNLQSALDMTSAWHAQWRSGGNMRDVTQAQLRQYQSALPAA